MKGCRKLKKTIILGIVFCSIWLGGCNKVEVLESEHEVAVSHKAFIC